MTGHGFSTMEPEIRPFSAERIRTLACTYTKYRAHLEQMGDAALRPAAPRDLIRSVSREL
jgi:hypothetical protein